MLEDIQKQLGLATDAMTARAYYHVTQPRRIAKVDKLEGLLSNVLSTID